MPLPDPVPALVIRYSYLWRDEYIKGQQEGSKDRPCAVILVAVDEDGDQIVSVFPITHSPPLKPADAMEIPAQTKRRLGLDGDRSWIVLTEANRFVWPGPDLRPSKPGDLASVAYGLLPARLFDEVCRRFVAKLKERVARAIPRTE